ncbi:hypothetical protein J1TS3_23750 [Siminovitchia fordii]|uniref:DUF2243 domain-containing protein n=2 Tax=Siminovitchia fordii TaxID=254759 RepID=A0ABQ4K685_9BACI|nr:hypothetical protein J1TS3_23750 [Siminovitchia fordii]
MMADLRRRGKLNLTNWWGGMLLGAGGFQLYDGLIQHKMMRIHQVRYVDNILLYDFVWNLVGALLLISGIALTKSIVRRRDS